MTKRRLGTIQSSRPGYGLLCLKTAYMASHRAIFKGPMRGRPDNFHEMAISKNGTGSRARTYDLRFWRPPLYQLSYARIVRMSAQQALPKSFRARCKEGLHCAAFICGSPGVLPAISRRFFDCSRSIRPMGALFLDRSD